MSEVKSYLYIPTIKEKYYEKINLNNADAIIFDLEDSVASEHKEESRKLLEKYFKEEKKVSKKVFVRINSEPIHSKQDIKLICLKTIFSQFYFLQITVSMDQCNVLESRNSPNDATASLK